MQPDIRKIIEQSGKSDKQIAEEVGCSQPYLSLLKSGERQVGQKFLTPLAECLGISPASLRPDLAEIFRDAAE